MNLARVRFPQIFYLEAMEQAVLSWPSSREARYLIVRHNLLAAARRIASAAC
jgi:hypothetical protein